MAFASFAAACITHAQQDVRPRRSAQKARAAELQCPCPEQRSCPSQALTPSEQAIASEQYAATIERMQTELSPLLERSVLLATPKRPDRRPNRPGKAAGSPKPLPTLLAPRPPQPVGSVIPRIQAFACIIYFNLPPVAPKSVRWSILMRWFRFFRGQIQIRGDTHYVRRQDFGMQGIAARSSFGPPVSRSSTPAVVSRTSPSAARPAVMPARTLPAVSARCLTLSAPAAARLAGSLPASRGPSGLLQRVLR